MKLLILLRDFKIIPQILNTTNFVVREKLSLLPLFLHFSLIYVKDMRLSSLINVFALINANYTLRPEKVVRCAFSQLSVVSVA